MSERNWKQEEKATIAKEVAKRIGNRHPDAVSRQLLSAAFNEAQRATMPKSKIKHLDQWYTIKSWLKPLVEKEATKPEVIDPATSCNQKEILDTIEVMVIPVLEGLAKQIAALMIKIQDNNELIRKLEAYSSPVSDEVIEVVGVPYSPPITPVEELQPAKLAIIEDDREEVLVIGLFENQLPKVKQALNGNTLVKVSYVSIDSFKRKPRGWAAKFKHMFVMQNIMTHVMKHQVSAERVPYSLIQSNSSTACILAVADYITKKENAGNR
mgnify:CR=1 FL=1